MHNKPSIFTWWQQFVIYLPILPQFMTCFGIGAIPFFLHQHVPSPIIGQMLLVASQIQFFPWWGCFMIVAFCFFLYFFTLKTLWSLNHLTRQKRIGKSVGIEVRKFPTLSIHIHIKLPILPNFFFSRVFDCFIFFDYRLDGWKRAHPSLDWIILWFWYRNLVI